MTRSLNGFTTRRPWVDLIIIYSACGRFHNNSRLIIIIIIVVVVVVKNIFGEELYYNSAPTPTNCFSVLAVYMMHACVAGGSGEDGAEREEATSDSRV
jgi:hypothetical protein